MGSGDVLEAFRALNIAARGSGDVESLRGGGDGVIANAPERERGGEVDTREVEGLPMD